MKLNKIVLAAVALTVAFSSPSKAAVIAQWDFESPNPVDATATRYPFSIPATIGPGIAGGYHASATTTWTTPVGNGSANSFSSNNWAIGDYYEFETDTVGFNGINLSWNQTSSNTGPRDFKLSYSLDGATFSDFATYSVLANATPNTWTSTTPVAAASFSQDLSSIVGLNNSQVRVFFRLTDISTVSANGGTVATAGTSRVDNFTVNGTAVSAVPVPGAVWLFGSALMGMLGFKRRKV